MLSKRLHCERAKDSAEKLEILPHLLLPVSPTQRLRRSRRKNELCGCFHTLGSMLPRSLVHILVLYFSSVGIGLGRGAGALFFTGVQTLVAIKESSDIYDHQIGPKLRLDL